MLDSILHPLQFYELKYKPTPTPHNTPQTARSYIPKALQSPVASELSAQDELDHFLRSNCPEGQRLLITAPGEPPKEYLVVNPEVANILQRKSPEHPLPRIPSDVFIRSNYKQALSNAKELTVQHDNGRLQNDDQIKENLDSFLEILRHPQTKRRVEQKRQEMDALNNEAHNKKKQAQGTKVKHSTQPKKEKPSQQACEPQTDDEDELMFNLEI